MPIIGLSFNTVEAKRERAEITGEIKVNSTPKIKDVRQINIPTLGKKALSLSFEFTTTYEPGIAKIKLGGDVLYLTDKSASVLRQWKTKKTLPEEISIEVLNHLFRRCLLKISSIADDLQLPPPIQIPRVRPRESSPSYVG